MGWGLGYPISEIKSPNRLPDNAVCVLLIVVRDFVVVFSVADVSSVHMPGPRILLLLLLVVSSVEKFVFRTEN